MYIIESSQLLQYTQTNLEEDTIYAFSVSTVREGDMGEGPRGPPMTVKTLCEELITPTAVMATVTDLNQLNVTWQVDDNDVTCSTGITGYTIYYKVDGSSDDPQRVPTVSGSIMYTIIEGLEPGENYTFMVSLTTDQESPLSEASMAVTYPMPSTPKPQDVIRNAQPGYVTVISQSSVKGTDLWRPILNLRPCEETVYETKVVPDGNTFLNHFYPRQGDVGHLVGSIGLIPAHPNQERGPEVSGVPLPGSGLPVCRPTIWPIHDTKSLHQGKQIHTGISLKEGHDIICINGQMVYHFIGRGLKERHRLPCFPPEGPRLDNA
ncbi:putative tyrosine-protein kinase [Apostichopus japonicus]|uniref:Putative tyrosine-protein kinase n=1 Tax=Stichopus japonicus TaxID=307972 RepID=A0A2G8KE79_STIJA|nr:putative tyrosine-protein kinase [Apostichopus japonicus]